MREFGKLEIILTIGKSEEYSVEAHCKILALESIIDFKAEVESDVLEFVLEYEKIASTQKIHAYG